MSRIRMSEAQFSMFQQEARRGPTKGRAPRQQKPREELPENILENRILDFLRARGWTVTRNQVGTYVPLARIMRFFDISETIHREVLMRNIVRIGEKGTADYGCRRPIIPPGARAEDGPWPQECFFLEVKAPGKRPKPEQLAWLDGQRATGTMAWWVNSFEPDEFERGDPRKSHCFLRWYGAVWEARR